MPIKRRRNEAPLALELTDWLLDGQTRSGAAIAELEAQGIAYDAFIEFDTPGPDFRGLWQQHRAWLLEEWTRRGGAGRPWAARFDSDNGAAS